MPSRMLDGDGPTAVTASSSLMVDEDPVELSEYLGAAGRRSLQAGFCHLTAWMFTSGDKGGQTLVKDIPLRLHGSRSEALRTATAHFTWTWDPRACYVVLYTFPASAQPSSQSQFRASNFARWALQAIEMCTPRGLASWVGASDPNIEDDAKPDGCVVANAKDAFVVYVWSGKDADLTVKVTALARGYDVGKALRCTTVPEREGWAGSIARKVISVDHQPNVMDGNCPPPIPSKECQLLRILERTLEPKASQTGGRERRQEQPSTFNSILSPSTTVGDGRPPMVPSLKLGAIGAASEQSRQSGSGSSSSRRGTQSARAVPSGRRRMISETELDLLENPPKSARSSEASSGRRQQSTMAQSLHIPRPKTNVELIESFDMSPNADNSHLPAEVQNELRLHQYRTQCSEILPGVLYLGGARVASNLEILTEKGITHIVNTAADVCSNSFADRGFKYLTLFLKDTRDEPMLPAVLYHAVLWIHSAITEEKGKVLVHCFEGVSRSSTVVIAYLMWLRAWTYNRAFDWVKTIRPICNPNTGFTCVLIVFGKKLERGRGSQALLDSAKAHPTISRVTVHSLRTLPQPTSLMVALPVSAGSALGSEVPPVPLTIDGRFSFILQLDTSVVILRSRSTKNEITDKAIADHLHRVRSVEFGCDDDGDDPLETVEIFLDDEVDDAAVAALGRILAPGSPSAELCLESLVQTTDNPAWNDEYAAMSKVSRTGPEASEDTMKMTHVADFVPPIGREILSLGPIKDTRECVLQKRHEGAQEPGLNGGKAEAKTEVYCYPDVEYSDRLTQFEPDELEEGEVFIIFVPRRKQLVFWVGEGSAQPPDHRIETIRKSLCERHDLDESSVEVEIVYQGEEMEDFEEYFDDD
ncbi:Dual specificity protein phosphatase 14 [Perkinsus olseni]|uniref:Dual specificity protein phosphatase 14 n=1 Tax=Perkinsus olseni TaxID=32597 RepID=A0A7J6M9L9_PEROL|nr:Dual specificity protein phosphatase 14 [Perkinsus olseni]